MLPKKGVLNAEDSRVLHLQKVINLMLARAPIEFVREDIMKEAVLHGKPQRLEPSSPDIAGVIGWHSQEKTRVKLFSNNLRLRAWLESE